MAYVFTKYANPTGGLPSLDADVCAVSSDGEYVAVGFDGSPQFICYRWNGSDYVRMPNPSTLPTGRCRGLSFSPDGKYLAVGHQNSPFISIYEITGSTLTKLPNPSALTPSHGRGVCFSPDGRFLGVMHVSSPYISVYAIEDGVFVKRPNPSALPTGHGLGIDWAGPGPGRIACGAASSPYGFIYDVDSDTGVLTRRNNISPVLPSSTAYTDGRISVRRDSEHAVFYSGTSTNPRLRIYNLVPNTPTLIPNVPDEPITAIGSVAYSRTMDLLVSSGGSGPDYLQVWEYEGANYSEYSTDIVQPAGRVNSVKFSLDGSHMVVAHDGSPRIAIYKVTEVVSDANAYMGQNPVTGIRVGEDERVAAYVGESKVF